MCLIKKRIEPDRILRIFNIKTDIEQQPLYFNKTNYNTGGNSNETRYKYDENGSISAYYLPWEAETGLYIDIPCNNPSANLFLTPSLTGCLIGIKKIKLDGNDYYRICHWNSENHENLDLQRYTDWALPQSMTDKASPNNLIYYYSNKRPSAFYGEYYNNEWHFTLWQTEVDIINN